MSWLKVVATRVLIGELVHLVLTVVRPGLHVDHFLVVLIVFFVTTAFGVAESPAKASEGADERQ